MAGGGSRQLGRGARGPRPGECVTPAATASGGRAPYAFAWSPEVASDGGNITVCPSQTTTYGVNVTDGSGSGAGSSSGRTSRAGPADTGTTDEATDGGPSCVDPGSSPWSGCVTAYDGIVGPPPDPQAFGEYCQQGTPQNVPSPSSPSWSVCLPKALLPGQSYWVTVNYQVGTVNGPVPQSGVFASTGSCQVGPTVVPVQGWPILTPYWGGTFSQSACFTADARYPQLVYQGLTSIFSSFSSMGLSFQICSGCPGDL